MGVGAEAAPADDDEIDEDLMRGREDDGGEEKSMTE